MSAAADDSPCSSDSLYWLSFDEKVPALSISSFTSAVSSSGSSDAARYPGFSLGGYRLGRCPAGLAVSAVDTVSTYSIKEHKCG